MIINKTKNSNIALKYKICNNFFSQSKGLMFSRPKVLIFDFKKEKKISLHMLFVFYPIYVFFLNNNKEVVEQKKMNPFTFYKSRKQSRFIIEIPSRHFDKNSIDTGDKMEFRLTKFIK